MDPLQQALADLETAGTDYTAKLAASAAATSVAASAQHDADNAAAAAKGGKDQLKARKDAYKSLLDQTYPD